jgi:pyruvate/2-oxoglutarate dehydrogenase complex dihydrolipoamide dehydrogenase (E3) component
MATQADIIVVGMGPGGEDVAGRLAEAGLDVIGVEAELVGGECPYWGCIPSKMIIRAANLLEEGRRIPGMAGASSVQPDWAPVATRIRQEATDTWDDTVAVERFESKGGTLVRGRARLDGPGRVVVGGHELVATRGVVLNTGAHAFIPPIDGLQDTPFWTNREAIACEEAPASLAVLGGGAIGVELAQAFSRFGTKVTVLEAAGSLVAAEEAEAGVALRAVFEAQGITVLTDTSATGVHHDGAAFTLELSTGDTLSAQHLLVAVGRHVDLATLGVASVGLDPDGRALEVDDHLRVVGAEKLWGVGDVTGRGAFTHMSMYQADIVVNDVLGNDVVPADYRAVPRVTFTDPEIGSVGLSERQARDQGMRVRTGSTTVSSSARGWIHKVGNEGFIKVVEDADRGVLVGATSMGPWGGEVLGFLVLAIQAVVPTTTLAHMIYAYPTFHRGIETAVKDLSA